MRLSLVLFAVTIAACAADKKLPVAEMSNEVLAVTVSQPLDKNEIQQELGADIGDDMIVIRLTARPVSDKPVTLTRDDFLLVSDKDGQRSEPYAPGQIAGSATLAVTPNGVRRTGMGRARPSIGIGGLGVGAGGDSTPKEPDTKMEASRRTDDNLLLAALEAKMLPE